MMFSSPLLVFARGLFVSASPTPSRDAEIAARDTVPDASVLPLPVFSVFQTLKLTDTLNTATTSLSSLSPGDAGAANEDITTLVASILDGVNTALNKRVPKLELNDLLTPVDGAVTGLLTSLGGILPLRSRTRWRNLDPCRRSRR
ncbi:hypothetical protein DFH09DRAFT_1324749 [Mycena vulgaris]|nr:hypothetical protein DFH09DRAFT_1324749 [Mycena vulgaris]